jgi:hypothetical protein
VDPLSELAWRGKTFSGKRLVRTPTLSSRSEGTRVVLVNSDATTGVNATVDVGAAVSTATAIYLRAPSITSTTGVTLAGAAVSPQGAWAPQPAYALPHAGTRITVPVPAASAVLITAQ